MNKYDLSKIAFKGEKRFLSNMYPSPISIGGVTYPSSEHFYQAHKSTDPQWQELVLSTAKGEKVKTLARKHLGKTYTIREDWEAIKLSTMKTAVYSKFRQNKDLKEKLLLIEGDIVEENCWGDTFWGKVDGVGENHLGKILMKYREESKNNYKEGRA